MTSGLYLEAVADNQEATLNSKFKVKLEAINRSSVKMSWVSYDTFPSNPVSFLEIPLENNKVVLNYNRKLFSVKNKIIFTLKHYLRYIVNTQ